MRFAEEVPSTLLEAAGTNSASRPHADFIRQSTGTHFLTPFEIPHSIEPHEATQPQLTQHEVI